MTTNVPSKSIVARSKNSSGCRFQTFKRAKVDGVLQGVEVARAEAVRRGVTGAREPAIFQVALQP